MKRIVHASVGFAIAFASWTGAANSASTRPEPDRRNQVLNAYANLPLAFVENRGQADSRARFYAQGRRYARQQRSP